MPLLKNPKIILVITLAVVIPFVTYNLTFDAKQNKVLSEKIAVDQTSPSPSPVTSYQLPETSPSPTPSPKPSKSTYTIAIIGDSMADTMGESMEYLQESLKARYPQTNFNLYNYGIGDRIFVSAHDGIHPSVEGHLLMADLIAQTISLR